MYCPKEKQLNKFVKVACPKPKDLYNRIGPRNPIYEGSNDGSDYSDIVDFNTSKLDSLGQVSRDERTRLYEEYRESMSKQQQEQEQEQKE